MTTTVQFLDALKAKNGGCSDYRLAKILGCKGSAIGNYRAKRSYFDNDIAIRVANLLDFDPEYVVACCHLERAKSDIERHVFQRLADAFRPEHFVLCKIAKRLIGAKIPTVLVV